MSDKRFIALGSTHIKDTLTGEEFYAPSEDELLDLLNEQQATIEQLQRICETINSLYNKINHLKEENEQLKNKLNKGL